MISAMHEAEACIRDMRPDDLPDVSAIERRSYEFPWSHGVFRDCLLAGYHCIVMDREAEIAGYAILSIAAGEAHILNICVAPTFRSMGYGGRLLDEVLHRARSAAVREVFLEVRPSNTDAIALYRKKGFHKIADRPAYYRSAEGREDAAVFVKKLTADY